MTFLFLYTEISEYFLACCNQLALKGDVHIIRWPVNKEAPFEFSKHSSLKIYSKSDYNLEGLKQLVNKINPSVIVCSGWIDNDYLKITKHYFKTIPTVMTCDTHWRGDLKQQIARVLSRFKLLNVFTHAWVPGQIQKKYVQKLGFKNNNIETGFYCCDLTLFENNYQIQKKIKENNFPKRFLFVGRYYDFKGVTELWKAFIEMQNETPNEWELWCLGVGDVEPVKHPKIKHFGFIQPTNMLNYTEQTGIFVLPSRKEPWGVVVQEFAASGFPLLLSNKIGAKEQFLVEGVNGFEFEAENIESLKNALKKMVSLPTSALIKMGIESNKLSKTITLESWVNSLLKITSNSHN